MDRAVAGILLLCAVLAGALYAMQASAGSDATADAADAPEAADDGSGSTDPGTGEDVAQAVAAANPFAQTEGADMAATKQDNNADAFLDVIQYSEGTATAGDPYAVCYGYVHTVQDKARHPAEWYSAPDGTRVREWGGEPLDNLGPSYVGKVSTAAGAYQIKLSTWLGCKKALALQDFSDESQDAAALYLIKGRGALDAVKAGQFDQAIALCAPEWASLPGANYAGQGMRSIDALRAEFTADGGAVLS